MDYIQTQAANATSAFFQKVYGWMCGGLVISGLVAYFVANTPAIMNYIASNDMIFFIIMIAEFLLVIGLVSAIRKMSADVAIFMFLLYCFMTGLTLSVIFIAYTMTSIASIFFISAGMFAAMSVYGMVTKQDLSKLGQILIMALFGIIIAGIVNIFFGNQMVDLITSIIGVIIFTGLTAYDTQKIKNMSLAVTDDESKTKVAILGALNLYLDFINLFLELLRLFGKRR